MAVYGGLCALATFDRQELQKNVIFSRYDVTHFLHKQKVINFFFSSFKLFLELEPQLRDIIIKFYHSKYASCLKLLDDIKVIVICQKKQKKTAVLAFSC